MRALSLWQRSYASYPFRLAMLQVVQLYAPQTGQQPPGTSACLYGRSLADACARAMRYASSSDGTAACATAPKSAQPGEASVKLISICCSLLTPCVPQACSVASVWAYQTSLTGRRQRQANAWLSSALCAWMQCDWVCQMSSC